MRPRLLRPACFFSGSIRLFSGFFLVISSNVLTLIERRAGEVGLYLRIAMCKRSLLPALDLLEDVDAVALAERHNRLLHGLAGSADAASAAADHPALRLRLHIQRIDRQDLHVERVLNGG